MQNKPNQEKTLDNQINNDIKTILDDFSSIFMEESLIRMDKYAIYLQNKYSNTSKVSEQIIKEENIHTIGKLNRDLKNVLQNFIQERMSIKQFKWFHLLFDPLFETWLDEFYTQNEGITCSHDKTRFTIKILRQYIEMEKNQTLYEEYEGKKAYWSPNCVKDIEEVLTLYLKFKSLQNKFLIKEVLESLP